MIKLEKRRVYLKETWSMSYLDRYIFAVLKHFSCLIIPNVNPLKLSIIDLWRWAMIVFVFTPACFLFCFFEAVTLKRQKMPDGDGNFSESDDWYYSSDLWVVKRD